MSVAARALYLTGPGRQAAQWAANRDLWCGPLARRGSYCLAFEASLRHLGTTQIRGQSLAWVKSRGEDMWVSIELVREDEWGVGRCERMMSYTVWGCVSGVGEVGGLLSM